MNDQENNAAPAAPAPTEGFSAAVHQVRGALELCEPEDLAAFDFIIAAITPTPAPAAQADEREAFEAWRRSYEGDGFASSAAMRSAFRDGFNAAIAAGLRQQSDAELDTAFSGAVNAAVALERKQSATPADAASQADKRDAERMQTLCALLDSMDDLGNGFPMSVHEAFQNGGDAARTALDAIQRERQQGAQSNG